MDYSKFIVLLALCTSSVLASKLDELTLQPARSSLVGLFTSISENLSSFANLVLSLDNIINGNISSAGDTPQDAYLSVTELAIKYGYIIEEHDIETEDGYILTVHRLRSRNAAPNGKVALLMHGIIESSDSWLLQGPGKALGYMLADDGFDVWMGNARGNKHAMRHAELTPNNTDFWEFTWEEIGLYDLPATIDYVLNATDGKSVYYVGHSQGTTSFLVMMAMRPDYNDKIRAMFALSPVAWMGNVKSPFVRRISSSLRFLGYFMSNLKAKWPSMELLNKITAASCSYVSTGCSSLLYMLEGKEHKNIDTSLLPVILGHMPTGASAAQFVHYGQLVNSGRFSRFDFGEEINLEEYGVRSPPDYDVSRVSVPVEMFFSDDDLLSAEADVEILDRKLPNVSGCNFVEGFTHLDYLYASNAREEIYDKIVLKMNAN